VQLRAPAQDRRAAPAQRRGEQALLLSWRQRYSSSRSGSPRRPRQPPPSAPSLSLRAAASTSRRMARKASFAAASSSSCAACTRALGVGGGVGGLLSDFASCKAMAATHRPAMTSVTVKRSDAVISNTLAMTLPTTA